MKKYIIGFMVVAVAFAMATTLAFGQTSINDNKCLLDEEKVDKVYEKMIAHGGGSIDGFDTSSSVDAVMKAIDNGFKVIELDMEFSYDNKIIMLHDWDRTVTTYLGRKFDKELTINQFNNQLICGKFEPLTFEKLTKILDANPQIRIVTDTKGDNIKLLKTIAKEYPEYINRMIPQIYDYSEFDIVKELGYKDIIFTLYRLDTINYDELLSFVRENHIYAVTVGKNYIVKGLPEKLSKDGVIVYMHPIYTIEEAKEQFEKGVYGIYSSTLKPSEIQGYEAEYYLMQINGKGEKVKLTDVILKENEVRHVEIHGNMHNKVLKYKLDGMNFEKSITEIEDAPSELHEFQIEVWDKAKSNLKNPLHIMKYYLTKNGREIRILDKKYDYRVKILKNIPDFMGTISSDYLKKITDSPEKMSEILSQSFIAKAGKYYYYNNGEYGKYYTKNELIEAQKSIEGKTIIPLTETLKQLGATKITMDTSRYIYINMDENWTISQVYSYFVRKNIYNSRVSVPISLYRSRAMAGGEIISVASSRNFVEGNGLLIILPKDCKVNKSVSKKLVEVADLLYKS